MMASGATICNKVRENILMKLKMYTMEIFRLAYLMAKVQ